MTELEQVITCPGCEGDGWIERESKSPFECTMCDQRGMLVIDDKATQGLPKKRKPETVTWGERTSKIVRDMHRYRP